jgi:hypothetical protein
MSMFFRVDPGECPICGAPHCSCGGGPILVEQLPATADVRQRFPPPPLVAADVQNSLPDGSFTSATYRGNKKRRP